MKKILLATLSILFSCFAFAQKLDHILSESWKDNAWAPILKTSYSYGVDGFLTEELSIIWDIDSDGWVPTSYSVYTNDPDGNVKECVRQLWDTPSQSWKNYMRVYYSYTNSNKPDTILNQIWMDTIWVNTTRFKSFYNIADEKIGSIVETWQTGNWENYLTYDYTYDSLGRLAYYTIQSWDKNGQSWMDYYKERTSYTMMDTQQVELKEVWGDSSWKNNTRSTYSKDATGFIVNMLSEQWNADSGLWQNFTYQYYTKDTNGNLYQHMNQWWDKSIGEWGNMGRETYTYMTTTGMYEMPDPFFIISPNPVTDRLYISLPTAANSSISVMDLQGRTVSSVNTVNNQQIPIDITSLPTGIYLIKVECNNQVAIRKFVKN